MTPQRDTLRSRPQVYGEMMDNREVYWRDEVSGEEEAGMEVIWMQQMLATRRHGHGRRVCDWRFRSASAVAF